MEATKECKPVKSLLLIFERTEGISSLTWNNQKLLEESGNICLQPCGKAELPQCECRFISCDPKLNEESQERQKQLDRKRALQKPTCILQNMGCA